MPCISVECRFKNISASTYQISIIIIYFPSVDPCRSYTSKNGGFTCDVCCITNCTSEYRSTSYNLL